MKLQERWRKWKYMGFSQEVFLEHRPELDMHNLTLLHQVCGILAVVMVALAIVFGFWIQDYLRTWMAVSVLMILVLLLWISTVMLRRKTPHEPHTVDMLVLALSLLLYVCGGYLGTAASDGELAVAMIWLLLFVQIVFDRPPLKNLLTLTPCLALFLFFSAQYKSDYNTFYDMVHAAISTVVGLFMSYRKGKVCLANLVAEKRLRQANYNLYHTSTTDALTGLSNRPQIFAKMEQIRRDCMKRGNYLACVVLDMDDFKLCNDRYGHPVGDAVLRAVGEALDGYSAALGISVGRIGGEEFLAVWEEKDPAHCDQVADELRALIGGLRIPVGGHTLSVTVSTGVCALRPEAAERAYYFADKALYMAKGTGKNRFCRFSPEQDDFISVTQEQR